MNPSLAADVLLLAVDPHARYVTRGPVGPVMAGAVLCDELLTGRGSPRATNHFALRLDDGDRIRDDVGRSLCAAQLLAPLEHKVLGLFPRRGYAVLDPVARAQAAGRLQEGLTPGRARPGTAALAVLCATSGIARAVMGAPPKAHRRELAAHLNSLAAVVGPEITEVLMAVRRAYLRRDSDGGSGTFTSADGRDGYGDSGGLGDSGGGGDGGDGGGGGGD